MQHETAGDPMTGLKWTRKPTARIATELQERGLNVGPRTVSRLLNLMGYSLRVNHKKLSRTSTITPEIRNAQFKRITELREDSTANGLPIISVDTKKKELIGQFKNPGVAWTLKPIKVHDHDFPSTALAKAIPYGIYDIQANLGTIFVGNSKDTAEFAVDSIETWWLTEGQHRYPGAKQLVVLADGGGSNGSTNRVWKHRLFHSLAERHGISVTLAHYPPGTSKWNPIEHRLFSEISKHWAGRPLDSFGTMLNYISTTTTSTGLQVKAHQVDRVYENGLKITDDQMGDLPISWHKSMPQWNYTLAPYPN